MPSGFRLPLGSLGNIGADRPSRRGFHEARRVQAFHVHWRDTAVSVSLSSRTSTLLEGLAALSRLARALLAGVRCEAVERVPSLERCQAFGPVAQVVRAHP